MSIIKGARVTWMGQKFTILHFTSDMRSPGWGKPYKHPNITGELHLMIVCWGRLILPSAENPAR